MWRDAIMVEDIYTGLAMNVTLVGARLMVDDVDDGLRKKSSCEWSSDHIEIR